MSILLKFPDLTMVSPKGAGEIWGSYLILGILFMIGGLILWRKKEAV